MRLTGSPVPQTKGSYLQCANLPFRSAISKDQFCCRMIAYEDYRDEGPPCVSRLPVAPVLLRSLKEENALAAEIATDMGT